jgi:hypothetical protein
MNVPTEQARPDGHPGHALSADDSTRTTYRSARLDRLATADPAGGELVQRLLGIAVRSLPRAFLDGEFVFRLDGVREQAVTWKLTPSGKSQRYGAITALGLLRLPEPAQRGVLAGETCHDLVTRLSSRLDHLTDLGDVALTCWAAAEARHDALPRALDRLARLDDPERQAPVVDAAWTVSALVAARRLADVEEHLERARRRLLAARRSAVYSHVTGDATSWPRGHVGSFADQVYPVQALARLHASADDQPALAAADAVAGTICTAQGESGQWWWHYDSRLGSVVEGYPVYSVHQHAMAPMVLMDLAEAGGAGHVDAICRGLRWLADPPETAEALILDDPPITWRKVARSDRRKAVRGLRAASTRIRPGWRLAALDRAFPPGAVDHECRPYELGWLLFSWLSRAQEGEGRHGGRSSPSGRENLGDGDGP